MDHQRLTIRAFFAIPIPEQLRNHLNTAVGILQSGSWFPNARWLHSEQLHITLKFLPEVERIDIERIKQTMNSWRSTLVPFDLSPASLGAFPSKSKPRVIVLNIKPSSAHMPELIDLIESDMEKLNYNREIKQLKPHITLARIRKQIEFQWSSPDLFVKLFDNLPSFSVKCIKFFESQLSSQGARHSLIHEINW